MTATRASRRTSTPLYFGNLPAAFDGYRLVQLSDVHAAVFGRDNSTLIGAVKDAKPDVIVITGDLINNDNASGDDMGIVTPLIRALVAIAPVYYVTGNHEWDSGRVRELLTMLGGSGVTALRNGYVRLTIGAASIVLAGVDDPNGPADMKTPEQLVSEIRDREGDPLRRPAGAPEQFIEPVFGAGARPGALRTRPRGDDPAPVFRRPGGADG